MVLAVAIFDKQRYVDGLRGEGVSEPHARVHARVLDEALREGVATSSDLTNVWAEMKDLRTEIKELRGEVRALRLIVVALLALTTMSFSLNIFMMTQILLR